MIAGVPLTRHRWLLVRRFVQVAIQALFWAAPLGGWSILKGSLVSSRIGDAVPLSDPFVLLQSMAAGHWPATTAWMGAAIIVAFYAVAGGRLYCSWVCPVNPVTDAAAWVRRRAGLKERVILPRHTRLMAIVAVLAAATVTGAVVWEAVNPVTLLQRGLLFGGGVWLAILVPAAVFCLDLFGGRLWCGHLCPVGAFYGVLGRYGRLVVRTPRRAACDNCLACYAVCPESQVLAPVLKGGSCGVAPLVASADCTRCGRCIDVCPQDVFAFGLRRRASNISRKGECVL